MFKVGIIGCGRIVEEGHAPAFKELGEELKVIAIADPVQERLDTIGAFLEIESGKRYRDYLTMIERENLDFVDIAVPHALHEPVVTGCAKAGLHILLEKPLASDIEEGERIKAAVTQSGVRFSVIHNYLYIGNYHVACRLIRQGRIGKPLYMHFEQFLPGYWSGAKESDPTWRSKKGKSGGGALIDNGYHLTYVAESIMASPVKKVFCRTNTIKFDFDVEDVAVVQFEHESGGVSCIQIGWIAQASRWLHEIHGDKGSILIGSLFKQDFGDRPVALFTDGNWEYPTLPFEDIWGFKGFFRTFAKSLRENIPSPVSIETGLRYLKLIATAYESSRTGTILDFRP